MKKTIILSSIFLLAISAIFGQFARNRVPHHLTENKIQLGKYVRTYYVFSPKNAGKKLLPLLFVFHGGGGNPLSTDRRLGFTELARKEKFIVVYPAGIGRNWNDGRVTNVTRAHRENVDDVGFVRAMIEEISKDYPVDQKRIYSTGSSNGGIFSHYIGAKISDKFAAIAPVIGGIADPFHKSFDPEEAVSVLIIQGTEDRLVPYEGHKGIGLGRRRDRGKVIGTDQALKLWTKRNRTNKNAVKGRLPNTDPSDGCIVEKYEWRNGTKNTEVVLYKMIGGGHTWAGGRQYLPRRIVGNVCRDFSATKVIWEFFKTKSKL